MTHNLPPVTKKLISLKFSSNSEANASELPEDIEDTSPHTLHILLYTTYIIIHYIEL